MGAKITKEVYVADSDHVWVDGMQYVSLKRFIEIRDDANKELKHLSERVKLLTEENAALNILLRKEM